MQNASPQDFQSAIQKDDPTAILIDVRTPEEHREMRIEGVINMPIDTIEENIEELKKYNKIYVHCLHGGRSKRVCEFLDSQFPVNTFNLVGGIDAYEKKGYSICRSS